MDSPSLPDYRQRNFLFGIIVIGVLALLLREYFILVTQVEAPIRGDVREYVDYAWNLVHRHTFSNALPGNAIVAPDAYRGPGYPLFLAATMLVGGAGNSWYFIALHAQALLGTITVLMGVLLARHWLSHGWSLASGVLMALWPHHIAATGALLSEVMFGFMLMLALLLTAETARRRNTIWAIAAGVAYGYAYLVNPMILLFPPLVVVVFWRVGNHRQGIYLLLVALAFAAVWAGRDATLQPQPNIPGRATINFVQGSWPQYHHARNDAGLTGKDASPIAKSIMQAIDEETRLFGKDPQSGLRSMADRMALDPAYYARWYAFGKPWLLWDWDIRVGAGDVYFHTVTNSPLESHPLLYAIKTALHALNPTIFVLSIAAALGIIVLALRRPASVGIAPLLMALFFVYATLVHTVFQAEPRYAIPYRPIQLLLAVTTLAVATDWLRGRRPARYHLLRPTLDTQETGVK
jgi:4-amino-4-deoxy-L-arabinose transferase-like glycosyltransferase